MKCPVCAWEHPSMLCPRCGFDSSQDYGKYPTFGVVDRAPAVSALRKDWEERQRPVEPEIPPEEFNDRDFPHFESPSEPEAVEKPRKKLPWLAIAACAATLAVGIWIGFGQGSGTPASTGAGENVQMQNESAASESSGWRGNILKKDDPASRYVYGTDILRERVTKITFLDTLENAPDDAIDVSKKQDASVKLWAVVHGPYGAYYHLYFAANGGINAAEACSGMFCWYNFLNEFNSWENFHTTDVQDMSNMFANCRALTEIDLSSFDTRNVQNMSGMFSGCTALKELDLSGLDTSNVQNMSYLFAGSNFRTLDLSSFDTSNVQDMSHMFDDCQYLTNVNLRSFDTSKVQNMGFMFARCFKLTELDLNHFVTANVTDTTEMFLDCPAGADWQHLFH